MSDWKERLSDSDRPEVGDYKGSPTITLKLPMKDGEKFEPFTFGLKKARVIVADIKAIELFVQSEGKRI
jgi:hypothetical protein